MPGSSSRRRASAACKIMTVGAQGDDIQLLGGEIDGFAQVVTHRVTAARPITIKLPLAGDFQVANAAGRRRPGHRRRQRRRRACSPRWKICKARRAGWSSPAPTTARRSMSTTPTRPTRWRRCSRRLRPHAKGKLIVVFGCGGDRDTGKRPLMGAHRGRDWPTTSSSPTTIRAARIRPRSAPRSWPRRTGAREIGDRAQGDPRRRSPTLRAGDVLVIAGKGHETGQIVGDEVLPFSDHDGGRARALRRAGRHDAPLWTADADGRRDARGAVQARCRPTCTGLSIDTPHARKPAICSSP